MYTISFHENGKPFTLTDINSKAIADYLLKVIFKAAIEGTHQVSHLTLSYKS